MAKHNWSMHFFDPDGYHGNMRTCIQHWKCRLCGTTKQMPAQGDIKPPLEGCDVEFVQFKPIPIRSDELAEKEEYDEDRPAKHHGNRGKKTHH